MNESRGIEIKSRGDISVKSLNDINLGAGGIHVKAADSILLSTSGSSIMIDSTVHFKGDKGVTI